MLAADDASNKSAASRHRAVVDAWAAELTMQNWYEWKARTPS